jgi:RNA polymerase sigma-70 factor (ECF subfamily)
MRYLKDRADAEDAMISSFQTIFSKISSFKGSGSFEGWMKRVVVNHCLMELRKKHIKFDSLDTELQKPVSRHNQYDMLYEQDILKLLNSLPDGQRAIFNLYAIEGYKHREIAEILRISINTSKSQLIQARKKLMLLINDNNSESSNNESISK